MIPSVAAFPDPLDASDLGLVAFGEGIRTPSPEPVAPVAAPEPDSADDLVNELRKLMIDSEARRAQGRSPSPPHPFRGVQPSPSVSLNPLRPIGASSCTGPMAVDDETSDMDFSAVDYRRPTLNVPEPDQATGASPCTGPVATTRQPTPDEDSDLDLLAVAYRRPTPDKQPTALVDRQRIAFEKLRATLARLGRPVPPPCPDTRSATPDPESDDDDDDDEGLSAVEYRGPVLDMPEPSLPAIGASPCTGPMATPPPTATGAAPSTGPVAQTNLRPARHSTPVPWETESGDSDESPTILDHRRRSPHCCSHEVSVF